MPDCDGVDLVYVGDSPIHGRGLFAREPIRAGAWIGRYEGRPTRTNGMHVLWVEGDREGEWHGWNGINSLRFLNHAKCPNAEMDGRDLYAILDIAGDDEITIDYGEWFEE